MPPVELIGRPLGKLPGHLQMIRIGRTNNHRPSCLDVLDNGSGRAITLGLESGGGTHGGTLPHHLDRLQPLGYENNMKYYSCNHCIIDQVKAEEARKSRNESLMILIGFAALALYGAYKAHGMLPFEVAGEVIPCMIVLAMASYFCYLQRGRHWARYLTVAAATIASTGLKIGSLLWLHEYNSTSLPFQAAFDPMPFYYEWWAPPFLFISMTAIAGWPAIRRVLHFL